MTGKISYQDTNASPIPVSVAKPLPVTFTAVPGQVTEVAAVGREYEACPASATTKLGTTGAIGDDIDYIWIFPGNLATTGIVQVEDGGTVIWEWPAAQALTNLAPIFVPLNLKSKNATGWSVICGANVTALGAGDFT